MAAATIFSSCGPDNIGDDPSDGDDSGQKPPVTEEPGNTSGDPDALGYTGWNTTGKYLKSADDAKVNPNFFAVNYDEIELLSFNPDALTATLRFKGNVPKLYKGALISLYLDQVYPELCYIEEANANGNEVAIKFRGAELGELFFNQRMIITSDPSLFPDEQGDFTYICKEYFEDAETKAIVNPSEFVKFQDTYSLIGSHIPGLKLEHQTEFWAAPLVEVYFDRPVTKDNWKTELVKAEVLEIKALMQGHFAIEDDFDMHFELNSGTALEFTVPMKNWTLFTKTINVPIPIGGVPIEIPTYVDVTGCFKINSQFKGELSGYGLSMENGFDVYFGAKWEDGIGVTPYYDFKPIRKVKEDRNITAELGLDVEVAFDPQVIVIPGMSRRLSSVFGLMFEPQPYFNTHVGAKYASEEKDISFNTSVDVGLKLDASLVEHMPIFEEQFNQLAKCKTIDILKKRLLEYPKVVEEKKDKSTGKGKRLILGYKQKDQDEFTSYGENNTLDDSKDPNAKGLVKVETFSNMRPGTKGTTVKKDGRVSHKEEYIKADDLGVVVADLEVPGPMLYDYYFEVSNVDGDGETINSIKVRPTNKFKKFKATYGSNLLNGEITLEVDDYGRKIKEKGFLTKSLPETIWNWYVDDSYEELMDVGWDSFNTNYYYKYAAGLMLMDAPNSLDMLDQWRYEQNEEIAQYGYTFSKETMHDVECVHALGPYIGEDYDRIDVVYYNNIPMRIYEGTLEGFGKHYLTLKSFEIIEYGDEDHNHGEDPDDYGGDLEDGPGAGPGILPPGGDDDKDKSGNYVRVEKELDSWEGQYIIANSLYSPMCLDGKNPDPHTSNYFNYVDITVNDGMIKRTEDIDKMSFTIEKLPNGGYTIRTQNGLYIGSPEEEGYGFQSSTDTAYPHQISFDATNKCVQIQGYNQNTLCWSGFDGYFNYIPYENYALRASLFKLSLYKLAK